MSNTKAKTISFLLEDGTLKGVMCIEDSNWNAGELYSAPRESVNQLISSEACNKYGVYLLLSEDMVYVGQSRDLSFRIKQHLSGKDWWERVIVLTTKDDNLNRSDIDYLESVLIDKAYENSKLDCDNKKKGNIQKVTKFRKVELDQYLEEAFFILALIGVAVFDKSEKGLKKKAKLLISTPPQMDYVITDIQCKSDAIKLLSENGIIIENECNYAKRQKNRFEYWINPRISVVTEEWDLILNNQFEKELIYIHIPANTFSLSDGIKKGLYVRKDKPIYIDLNILTETLCDRRSGCDFSGYVKSTIKYGESAWKTL